MQNAETNDGGKRIHATAQCTWIFAYLCGYYHVAFLGGWFQKFYFCHRQLSVQMSQSELQDIFSPTHEFRNNPCTKFLSIKHCSDAKCKSSWTNGSSMLFKMHMPLANQNCIFIYSPNFLKLIHMFNISQNKLSKSTFFFACLFFVFFLILLT